MVPKRWVFPKVDREQQRAFASLLAISPVTASLLLARGIRTTSDAGRWLHPPVRTEHDPFLLPDLGAAVDRLHEAVMRGERICFYGDYDVDGTTATSIYVLFFQSLHANVRWYLPHRLREGYGLNEGAIRALAADGVRLLVTSDCGTTSHREVALAVSLGLDVIITDHHQSDDQLPRAHAVMNPHRADSAYPFRHLCSAALALKVVEGYQRTYGRSSVAAEDFVDLAALATVADVVPLVEENRALVCAGLQALSTGTRPGLAALKRVAGGTDPCTAATIAFRLAPRINAAGRLAHADLAVQLLTTSAPEQADQLAGALEDLNRQRQHLEERALVEAMAMVEQAAAVPSAIVVASANWHLGVVGIVAARLVERFHRPAIVLAVMEGGLAKGSVRSLPGFDVYQALSQCRARLLGYGGHPSAAGLTLKEDDISAFAGQFQQLAQAWAGDEGVHPLLHLDAEVKLMDVGPRLIRELERLHPFGAGNPEPTLAVRHLNVLEARAVGEGHLKLVVRQGRSLPFEGIGFRMGTVADRRLSSGQPIDLAFMPELQRWRGLDRVQLRIRDLRPAAAH